MLLVHTSVDSATIAPKRCTTAHISDANARIRPLLARGMTPMQTRHAALDVEADEGPRPS